MSFPTYPKYRASGVEWIGEVPAHWEVCPLKYNVRLLTAKTDRRENPVGLENIESWTGRMLPTSSEFEGEGVAFVVGDILFGKLRPYLAKVYLADHPGEAVGDFHVVRPRGELFGRYLQYQMMNREFITIVDGSTFGSKMPRASWESLGHMPLVLPPPEEQQMVADFLDGETAKIDALMAEQQRLMELMQEKRQALISHLVTKGLNSDAPMMPSGVAWLGDVPAHWEVQRLSPLSTKITNGYVGPTRDILVEDGVRYLQSLHIKQNTIRFDTPYFVTEQWSREHKKSILRPGDVLIVQTGDVGQTAVVSEEFEGCNCHALIIVSPVKSRVAGEWISWVLNSDYGVQSLQAIQTGALHPHLNCGDVKGLMIPLPPLEEQRFISAKLGGRLQALDALVEEARLGIELLKERRTALISAAVTGKIDVRNASSAKAA